MTAKKIDLIGYSKISISFADAYIEGFGETQVPYVALAGARKNLTPLEAAKKAVVPLGEYLKYTGANYRDFSVWVGMVGTLALRPNDYIVTWGANYMMEKGDPHKICAEVGAHERAKAIGVQVVPACVIIAKPQEDGESGIFTPTLDPCGTCRSMLSDSSSLVSPDAMFVKVRSTDGFEEVESFNQIYTRHTYKTSQLPGIGDGR